MRAASSRGGASPPAAWAALATGLILSGFLPRASLAASPESEEYREEGVPEPTREPIDSAAAAAARLDSSRADSVSRAAGKASAPGLPLLVLDPVPADTAGRPSLAILPTAAGRGRKPGPGERETVAEALRLGAEQARKYRILASDETARPFGRSSSVPEDCFSEACAARAARKVGADFLLVSELAHPGPSPDRPDSSEGATLALALWDRRSGKVKRTVRVRACPGGTGPIPFAQQAVWHLLRPEAATASRRADSAASPAGCLVLAEAAADSGWWRNIPWLNSKDTADNRMRWAAAGSGLLAVGLGVAWAQGQLLGEDGNDASPAGPLRSGAGAQSFLRGFFAAPDIGARYAAMGGAGIAHVGNSLAVAMNPAGVADASRESAVAAKRNLPGGTPSFHLSYAGPLARGWHQGLGIQHEGDDLANETTVQGVLAGDWGAVARGLAGLKSGAGLKLYLAKVGEGGTGIDRSTGHSFGLGLDLGLRLSLTDRIAGALSVRDAAGFLKHSNTFTDRSHWEMLPPEYRVGAAYQVDRATLLVMDGQKGLVADQVDHLRFGAEKTLFGFFALRGGFHQVFGRQPVRKLALGFGIDSEGMSDLPRRSRVSINYAYDFGLDEDEPLGTGQQFSIEAAW